MYRSGSAYNELDKLAIDVYLDYNIKSFPIDARDVCNRLGIMLVPYSELGDERELFFKRSNYGFLRPPYANRPATIYYNDDICFMKSKGSIRQTIFHEIKHYVHEDYSEDNPEDDDLAEHFARFFACPTQYLVKHNITDVSEIISTFGVSLAIAENASKAVINRMRAHGQRIFDYEQPLIDLIDSK